MWKTRGREATSSDVEKSTRSPGRPWIQELCDLMYLQHRDRFAVFSVSPLVGSVSRVSDSLLDGVCLAWASRLIVPVTSDVFARTDSGRAWRRSGGVRYCAAVVRKAAGA